MDDDPAHNIVFQGLETYMMDGGYIETLGLSTPSHGSWASMGASKFVMTYLNFTFDNTGAAQGKTVVRQTATIGADKKSYTGSGDFTYFDVNGEVVLARNFKVTATRIEIQAPAAPRPQLTSSSNWRIYARSAV